MNSRQRHQLEDTFEAIMISAGIILVACATIAALIAVGYLIKGVLTGDFS